MSAPARRLIAPFLLAASFAQTALGQVPGRTRRRRCGARSVRVGALRRSARRAERSAPGRHGRSPSPIASRSSSTGRSACSPSGAAREAESAIAAVVTADPSYLPGEAEASPRVRAAFSDVRRRLLPEIASARYARSEGVVRSQGPRARGAAVPPGDRAARRSRHGRQARGPADAVDRVPRSRRSPRWRRRPRRRSRRSPRRPPPPPAPQPDPNRIYTMGDKDVTRRSSSARRCRG